MITDAIEVEFHKQKGELENPIKHAPSISHVMNNNFETNKANRNKNNPSHRHSINFSNNTFLNKQFE